MPDWIKSTLAEFLNQAEDFSAKISASFASFGLASSDATGLASAFTSFHTAYDLANDPATRTPVAVEMQVTTHQALEALMRADGRRIQANPAVTNAQRVSLGLTVRDVSPTPVPAPATRPLVDIVNAVGRTLSARLADELTPTRRARAAGSDGAQIFSYVGENPPADLAAWKFEGQSTRTSLDVTFPNDTAIGAKVWICARWYNLRGEAGPVSDAASSYVTGGVAEAA